MGIMGTTGPSHYYQQCIWTDTADDFRLVAWAQLGWFHVVFRSQLPVNHLDPLQAANMVVQTSLVPRSSDQRIRCRRLLLTP